MRAKRTHEQLVQRIESKRQKLKEEMKRLTEKERVATAKAAADERKQRQDRSRRLGAALHRALVGGLISIDTVAAWLDKLPLGKERDHALEALASLRQMPHASE